MWFDIIKSVEVLTENSASKMLDGFKTAVEKGYPAIITPLSLVAKIQDGELAAFTSFNDMGEFFFVGNSLTNPKYKGRGYFTQILASRDEYTKGKPRITLLNPLDSKSRSIVRAVVTKKGGKEVTSYADVQDIMDEQTYKGMKSTNLDMFRYKVI